MDVKTTRVYTHVLNVAVEGSAVRSSGCGKLSQGSGGINRADQSAQRLGGRVAGQGRSHCRQSGCRLGPATGPLVLG